MQKCISSTCFVIDSGKILFLKHKKLGKWMPPGGHVEPNETPIDAIHREVMEETGYSIDIIDTYKTDGSEYMHEEGVMDEMIRPVAIFLEHVKYATGQHDHFDLIYLAKINGNEKRKSAEHSDDMKWFGRDEIDDLDTFENCKITAHKALDVYEKSDKVNKI